MSGRQELFLCPKLKVEYPTPSPLRRRVGGVWVGGVLFIDEPLVLRAVPSWLFTWWAKPGLGGGADASSAGREFCLGQAPHCWDWFEQRRGTSLLFPNRNLSLVWLWSFQSQGKQEGGFSRPSCRIQRLYKRIPAKLAPTFPFLKLREGCY